MLSVCPLLSVGATEKYLITDVKNQLITSKTTGRFTQSLLLHNKLLSCCPSVLLSSEMGLSKQVRKRSTFTIQKGGAETTVANQ